MSTAAVKQPQDHKQSTKNTQRDEAEERTVTFEYDGDEWSVQSADVKQLEFLAALEDESYIVAMRLALGSEQAARFFKGRKLEDIGAFFDAMGEAVGSGNR